MTIQIILEEHRIAESEGNIIACACDHRWRDASDHYDHVAEVLEQHINGRMSKAWDEGALASENLACINPACGACENCDTALVNPYK